MRSLTRASCRLKLVFELSVIARRSCKPQKILLSTTSTCPITGTSSSKSSTPQIKGKSGRYEDIPGPTIYPLIGSLRDFFNNGGTLQATGLVYYKKYGMISKQNINGKEILIYDPREHLKGGNLVFNLDQVIV